MTVVLGFRIGTGSITGIPHVGLGKTVGRYAVREYARVTPVRTGAMRAGWVYGVDVKTSGQVQLTVGNPVPYAGIVFRRNGKRFAKVPRNIHHFVRQLGGAVS